MGSTTFTATLLTNATVTAFKSRLPITLSTKELNSNETFAQLPNDLPINALVFFYEPFRTLYRYRKLGRIDNPAGLATALGSGSVTVKVELP